MIFSVEVPDTFAKSLRLDGPQPGRRALEALALDGYRSGELSRGQVSELLDLEFNETMQFLKEHGCARSITFEDFEQESKGARELLGR
jgi:predicted HTH domain antitoxin